MATTTDYFLQGFQQGANVTSEGLRLQELKSQAALRRMQEARAAQELELMVRKYDDQIQQQADIQKAAAKYELYRAPVIPVPNISGGGGTIVPNPMRAPNEGLAFTQAFLPLAKDAGEAQRIAQTGAMMANKPAMDQARIDRDTTSAGLNRARTQAIQNPVPEDQRAATAKSQGLVPVGLDDQNRTRFGRPLERETEGMPEDKRASKAQAMGLIPVGVDKDGNVNYGKQGSKTITRFNKDGTVEIINGATESDITSADRSNLKQRTIKLEDTVRKIQPVIENVDKLFGPIAAGKTVVVDRLMANINPSLAVGSRIEGRQAAKFLVEGVIRSLTEGQGQLSNKDVERITSMFPELNSIEELAESPARAKALFKGLQKQLAREAVTDARMLNEKPTIDVLRHADPNYVKEEFKAGRITEEDYIKAINESVHRTEVEEMLNRRR